MKYLNLGKYLSAALLLSSALFVVVACNDDETYADQVGKERRAINQYIADQHIKVISESQFFAQDSMTNVAENEYVLFNSNGVYMQIINKGCGEKIQKGTTTTVLSRFSETNLLTETVQLDNLNDYKMVSIYDKMSVTNTSGTFTASFISGSSLMYSNYGSAEVPSGWLVPLTYINVGRYINTEDEVAHVKLIVPHSAGQSASTYNVYPCFYEITYQLGR